MSKKNTVHLEGGVAWKIIDGKRSSVNSIEVPANNDCCKLNCCDLTIDYISPTTNALVKIPLDDIANLLGLLE